MVLYPVPLSAAAIVLGSIAYVRGSRPLGAGAVIIGFLSLVMMLVLFPMLF
ncbi:hypothetical protein [Paenibacillus ginsengarvi]|uniref:hypothetical protein n=1 Tax=Paenibacillus ginsengarvi TaxID=400777 RepID=UPI001876DB23|nr:hypothetical protein [Paenibacillus ginsengarvi]